MTFPCDDCLSKLIAWMSHRLPGRQHDDWRLCHHVITQDSDSSTGICSYAKYLWAVLFFPVSPVLKGRYRDILQLLALLTQTPANSSQRVFVRFQPIRVIPQPGSESDKRLISGTRQEHDGRAEYQPYPG